MNILFLCTGNSCRSIMAEAMLRHMAPPSITVQSAGSKPTGFIHPKALETLEKNNISTQGLASKSWDNLSPVPDVVITLCASAHGETCPMYLGKVVRSHWGMDDPAKADDLDTAFKESFKILEGRIAKFLALPLHVLEDELKRDETSLKLRLDNIVNNN